MQNFPCWLRHFWETDNLFSCEERIKRKKNAERALLSIHLFVSLSSLSLNLSLHFPLVLPYSFWPFIIFPCPTAFSSLPFSFVFPSRSFLLFIPISSSCLVKQASGLLCLSVEFHCHAVSFLVFFPLTWHPYLLSPLLLTGCPRWAIVQGMHFLWHYCGLDVVTFPMSVAVTLSATSCIFLSSRREPRHRLLPASTSRK